MNEGGAVASEMTSADEGQQSGQGPGQARLSDAIRLSDLMTLMDKVADAAFSCGNWRKSDEEPYAVLSEKLAGLRAELDDALKSFVAESGAAVRHLAESPSAAWLITGSKIFRDSVRLSQEQADARALELKEPTVQVVELVRRIPQVGPKAGDV